MLLRSKFSQKTRGDQGDFLVYSLGVSVAGRKLLEVFLLGLQLELVSIKNFCLIYLRDCWQQQNTRWLNKVPKNVEYEEKQLNSEKNHRFFWWKYLNFTLECLVLISREETPKIFREFFDSKSVPKNWFSEFFVESCFWDQDHVVGPINSACFQVIICLRIVNRVNRVQNGILLFTGWCQEKPKRACSWPFTAYREILQRKIGEKFWTHRIKETAWITQ